MSFGAILVLAISLAMDATAAAAARGSAATRIRFRDVVVVAAFFGGVHLLMPALGAIAGARIGHIAQRWDHWIAFALLGAVGAKMLHEARHPKPVGGDDRFDVVTMCGLALATGIDALAIGVSLPMLGAPVAVAIVTIGAVATIASVVGLFAGHRIGRRLGKHVEALGGLLLIGLGAKILVEHLTDGR